MTALITRPGIGLFVLIGLVVAAAASAGSLPIKIDLPSQCQMTPIEPGVWECTYNAENDRQRRLLFDFHEIELDETGRETLSNLDEDTLELILNDEIRGIDERREEAMPSTGYARFRYEFLDDTLRPRGFVSCVLSRDTLRFEGSDIRNDRASLHCWAAEPRHGVVYQMLLSLIEYNDPAQSATPTLEAEFDRIVSSVVRN